MRWVGYFIVVIVAAIVKAANFPDFISLGELDVRPDPMLIIMIFYAVNSEPKHAVITSFLAGFMADLAGQTMGPCMLSYGIVGTALNQIQEVLVLRRMSVQGLLIFVVSMLAGVFTLALIRYKLDSVDRHAIQTLFYTAVYTAVVGPVLWVPLDFLSKIFGLKRKTTRRGYGY